MYDLPTSLGFSGPFLAIHPARFPHLSSHPSNILVVASGVVSDVGSSLESRAVRGSTDEIKAHLIPELDLCGRDGPSEKAEFVGAEG